jgi:hypothetical protein
VLQKIFLHENVMIVIPPGSDFNNTGTYGSWKKDGAISGSI